MYSYRFDAWDIAMFIKVVKGMSWKISKIIQEVSILCKEAASFFENTYVLLWARNTKT